MKNIVFTYSGYKYTNIGDYIQSLAAKQFYDENNIIYFHRDQLNNYHGEPVKVIMNGWFTHQPQNWPPSENIIPLFVAFHINSSAYKDLLSDTSIAYLKKFEPIGCRDKNTASLLKEKGVKSYFSSCMTTTLGRCYYSRNRNEKIYVVDPVHYVPELHSRIQKYKFLFFYIIYFFGINRYINNIKKNNIYFFSFGIKNYDRFVALVRSYIIVRQLLSSEDMKRVTVLTQFHKENEYATEEQRFARAKELLHFYSEAKLVITSRIHCALPCLGLGTPVIFLKNLDDSKESTCRFEGLSDFFNIISFKRNKVITSFCKLPLDVEKVKNKTSYKAFVDDIVKKVQYFLKS